MIRIAIASGKGGTGKTTVAVSLYQTLRDLRPVLADCDVEAPNAALFFGEPEERTEPVYSFLPEIITNRCTLCGRCAEGCNFGALVRLPNEILLLPDQCHACKACQRLCPENVIRDSRKKIGEIGVTAGDEYRLVTGRLEVGQALSPPLIRAVRNKAMTLENSKLLLVDTPPGTSCPAVEAVRDSDFVVLVTEATPFGLNDLKLAVEMLRFMKIAFGVVINRVREAENGVAAWCASQSIPVLLTIPDDRTLAEGLSRGKTAVDVRPELKPAFAALWNDIQAQIAEGRP